MKCRSVGFFFLIEDLLVFFFFFSELFKYETKSKRE